MSVTYNFCAGPAMLPTEVMKKAQQEFINWHGTGSSIMELSHRSSEFVAVAKQAEVSRRKALQIIEKYTGDDPEKHKWCFIVKDRGAKVFSLLVPN